MKLEDFISLVEKIHSEAVSADGGKGLFSKTTYEIMTAAKQIELPQSQVSVSLPLPVDDKLEEQKISHEFISSSN